MKIDNLNFILGLIKEKDYEKIIDFLKNEEQKSFSLSEVEYDILKLSKALVDIIKTNNIPEKTIVGTNKVRIAIREHDYELALQLCQNNESFGLPNDKNAVYLLLVEINQLTSKLKESMVKQQEKTKATEVTITEKIEVQKQNLPITQQLIDYAIKELVNNNVGAAFRAIYSYLAMFDKSEYEFLVVNLIKISLIEKDMTFSNPIKTLQSISDDSFVFDESEYIKYLYEALLKKENEKVKLYFDIISKANEPITGIINYVSDDKHEIYSYRRNQAINRINVASRTLGVNYAQFVDGIKKAGIEFSRFAIGDLVITNPDKFLQLVEISAKKTRRMIPDISVNANRPQNISSEEDLLQKKVEELKQGKGFVILGEADNEKIQRIKRIIRKNYDDVVWFVVGDDELKMLAIKHRRINKEGISFRELIAEANKAYNACDYELCITKCKELLSLTSYPNASTFAKIGLAYLRQGKIKTAIEYLSMATMVSKWDMEDDRKFDFTEFIERLGGKISKDDKDSYITRKIKMNEKDFETTSSNYGITNFDEIAFLVLEQNISINEACIHFGLSLEQTNIVKLIFARNYYAQGDYITGDRIIKHVEQSKNKTQFVIKLINELRRNKMFYKNRITDDTIFVKKISL